MKIMGVGFITGDSGERGKFVLENSRIGGDFDSKEYALWSLDVLLGLFGISVDQDVARVLRREIDDSDLPEKMTEVEESIREYIEDNGITEKDCIVFVV